LFLRFSYEGSWLTGYLTTVGDRGLVALTRAVVCSAGGNVGKLTNCLAVTSQVNWICPTPWRLSLGADERLLHGASGRAHKGDHLLIPELERERWGGGRGLWAARRSPLVLAIWKISTSVHAKQIFFVGTAGDKFRHL